MAAGLTMRKQALPDFMRVFDQIVRAQLTDSQLQHALLSDGGLADDDLNLEVAALLRDSGPWGQTFPEPLFDDVFEVLEQRIIGDKHLRLRLLKDKKIITAVAFFVDMQTWPDHRCRHIRAVYRLDVNEYKGRREVQLIVEHLEKVEAKPACAE
jgi:single-stranded-DNA-specific exonuclease